MYPTFDYRPLTRTSYRVVDAHTGEEYGTVESAVYDHWTAYVDGVNVNVYPTRLLAAQAVYRARYAHGFEAGAL